MNMRISTIIFVPLIPICTTGQENDNQQTEGPQRQPEEILITGERSLQQLRTQMWNAEKQAYDIFNQFNDESRFNIICRMHQPTGTRIERQTCRPNFVANATAVHGQAFLESYRNLLDPSSPTGNSPAPQASQAATIASQQKEYQEKMQQVAEEHPEFLNAIIQYSELRQRYEASRAEESNTD